MTKTRFLQFLPVIGAFALWELVSRAALIPHLLFPPPSVILGRVAFLLVDAGFLSQFASSLSRLLAGLFIAIPLGAFLGIYSEIVPFVGSTLRPWISFLYPVPKIAVFPLLISILGIGEAPKIAVIAIGAFFLVYLSAASGAKRLLGGTYMDAVRVFDVTNFDFHYQILLKGSLPELLTGIKAGAGYGWIMVVSSEFVMSERGLGVFIWSAWDQFKIIDVYAGLMILSLCGFLTFAAIDLLSRKVNGA